MTTHSSILAWGIPWIEEPGGLHEVVELDTTETLTHTGLLKELQGIPQKSQEEGYIGGGQQEAQGGRQQGSV